MIMTDGFESPDADTGYGWSIVRGDDVAVLRVHGEIDIAAEVGLTATAEAVLTECPLRCDLSEVSFIDSSGVRIFLELHKRHESRFTVGAASAPVLRVFELSGVTDFLMGSSHVRTTRQRRGTPRQSSHPRTLHLYAQPPDQEYLDAQCSFAASISSGWTGGARSTSVNGRSGRRMESLDVAGGHRCVAGEGRDDVWCTTGS